MWPRAAHGKRTVERFYRAALIGLRALDLAQGRDLRFGVGADKQWEGFQGHLGTLLCISPEELAICAALLRLWRSGYVEPGPEEIGSVDAQFMQSLPPAACFFLAGRAWEVKHLDWERGQCRVELAPYGKHLNWHLRPGPACPSARSCSCPSAPRPPG